MLHHINNAQALCSDGMALRGTSSSMIDCNGSDTFKAGHIPGAIDYETKGAELEKLLPADKSALVVAYCGSVYCPAYKSGADAAAKLGYTNVKHYAGGLAGWQESGEKLEK